MGTNKCLGKGDQEEYARAVDKITQRPTLLNTRDYTVQAGQSTEGGECPIKIKIKIKINLRSTRYPC